MVVRILCITAFCLAGAMAPAQALLHVEGLLHVQSGGLLHVQGDIESSDGPGESCAVDLKGMLKLEGDWTNSSAGAVFQGGNTGTAAFVGDQGTQKITGSTSMAFPHVLIDKDGIGSELQLETSAEVYLSLDLTDDVLALRGNDITLYNADPGSLLRSQGISPPFSASTDGGYISSGGGNLLRKVSPDHNGATYLFPMGTGIRFRPLELISQTDSTVLVGVRFYDQIPPSQTSLQPDLASVNPNWYHQIDIGRQAAVGDQVRIYYDPPTDNICNVSQVTLAQYADGLWEALSPTNNSFDAPYLGHATYTLDSSFQGPEIALAGKQLVTGLPSCVFPPDKLVLNAQVLENSIELSWVTDAEAPTDVFYLDRSLDGVTFSQLHSRSAQGIQPTQSYVHEDATAIFNQRYFYRIRQRDQNGGTRSSNVIEAILTEGGSAVLGEFFPNPNNGSAQFWLSVEIAQQMEVQFFNALGQTVRDETWTLEAGYQVLDFNFADLAKGMYFAVINIEGKKSLRRLVVD